MKKISLDGKWNLVCEDKNINIEACVPGCVHTDLKNAGMIEDIFYRDNAENYQWIEHQKWTYSRTFSVEKTENAYLVFEGLDTYCDVVINGIKLSFDNMFITHRVKADTLLKKGENEIAITFYPPAEMVEGREALPGAFTTERLHTRRIQCTYGWDWVQRLITFGIYRPVYIEYEEGFFCKDVYIYTSHLDTFGARVTANADFSGFENGASVKCEIKDAENKVVYKKECYIDTPSFRFDADIQNPELWDINNDENPMYTFSLSYEDSVFEQKFGIRTVRILQRPDEIGSDAYNLCKALQDTPSGKKYDHNDSFSSFEVILNGRKILCKGANWVPCEPFVSEEADEKITKILEMAKSAGMNTVRVWGGGLFEKDYFYNECDRLGLLVIQDFLMACGQYPEHDADFIRQLQKEAEFAVKKLRNHPSLMWWNGDNENAVDGADTMENFKGRKASLFGAMPYINKYDYTRDFFASSPYGGNVYASKSVGTTHHTQFLRMLFDYIKSDSDGSDYLTKLKEFTARFIAEEPCFGASSKSSMLKFMTEDDILNGDDIWLYHTKGNPGLDCELYTYFSEFAEKILGKFENGEDRLFKYQYLHYEWIRVSMENTLRNLGFCGGIIYWMLNDCWPSAAGWSIIDYYLKPKSGFYSFRNAAKDCIVSVTEENGNAYLYLCNAGSTDITKEVTLKYIDFANSKIVAEEKVTLSATSNCSTKTKIAFPDENVVVVAQCEGYRTFFKTGKLSIYRNDENLEVTVKDNTVTLKAGAYIHAVELCGDGVFEDNFFSLLPGEEKKVEFSGNTDIETIAYRIK